MPGFHRRRPIKLGSHHTHHFEWLAVQQHLPAHCAPVAAKMQLPRTVREDDHAMASGRIVSRTQRAPQQRTRAKGVEIARRNGVGHQALGHSARRRVGEVVPALSGRVLEQVARRERLVYLHHAGVATADAAAHVIRADEREPVRVVNEFRMEQQPVQRRVDRSVHTDPEHQCADGGQREQRRTGQRTQGDAERRHDNGSVPLTVEGWKSLIGMLSCHHAVMSIEIKTVGTAARFPSGRSSLAGP